MTTYFENRIVEAVYGPKRAEQEAALMYANILETLAEVGADAPGTALASDGEYELGSAIAYDKGAFFLRTVERIVGRERFDAWLQQWFDNHAFQPATSQMFLDDMMANLVANEAEAEALTLREWIFEPGLPANVAKPDPAAFAEVDAAVRTYAEVYSPSIDGPEPPSRVSFPQDRWETWTSAERQRFLDNVPDDLTHHELRLLNDNLGLSQTSNNEELFLWLEMALARRYDPAVPLAEDFLARVGRAKFVRPLFQVLWDQGEWGRPIARRIYDKTRGSYHSVTRAGVDRIMKQGD